MVNEGFTKICAQVQLCAHGIARGGMSFAQIQLSIGSIGRSTPPGQQARWSSRPHSFQNLR